MNSKQRIGLAVGGGVIAVAAAVGVGAYAANLANGSADQSNPAGMPGYGQAGGGFGRGGQGFDTTAVSTQLASKLGVDEAKMKTALDNAVKANRPSGAPSGGFTPGSRPSGAMPSGAMPSGAMPSGSRPSGGFGGSQRLEAMAKSIATELNLDESKVLTALQEVMSSMGGGRGGAQPRSQPTS
ncbi:MAG: hypothetical protein J0I14_07855 [Propionibacteriaceae bacterium]|nr:hypothetical protein [Propionibacteriaceae bacterium]